MYFAKPGPENTDETVSLALETAAARGISHIVVASYSGYSARKLANDKGIQIICVSGANGADTPGQATMAESVRRELEACNIPVLSTSHILSGVERGLSAKAGGMYPGEIMSHTLRLFGQGTKVCVEAAIMALDAGLLPYGQPIIALGGTVKGIDTALIMTPAHAANVLGTKIHEIICKPY